MGNKNTIGINFIERLSGGNHELFHSNLLAFLAEHEPEFFQKLFELGKYDTSDIGREDGHCDLILHEKNINGKEKDEKLKIFVLENKMKSLPTKNQLIRYEKNVKDYNKNISNGKYNDCRFILLTLIEPNWKLKPWEIMTYEELLDKMKSNLNKLNNLKVSYLRSFIEDYINYVEFLVGIIKNEERFIETNPTINELNTISNKNNWERIMRLKARYHVAAAKLSEKCNGLDIRIETPFHHGSPILEALIYFDPEWGKKYIKAKQKKGSKIKKEDDWTHDMYFLHIQDKKLNHGFRIYNSESALYKKSKIREENAQIARNKFLEKIWLKVTSDPIGKKISEALLQIATPIELQRYITEKSLNYNNLERNPPKKPAYVFDKYAMPYLTDTIENKRINYVLDRMEEEIKAVAKVCGYAPIQNR